jgi:cation-transporting ATPase 13A1
MAGMLTAGMFFFISNSKPLERISRARPHPNIFSPYVFISLMGQFAVYITFLMFMQATAHALMPAVRAMGGWVGG